MLAEIKQAEGSVQNIADIPDYIKQKYKETFEIDGRVFINLAAFRGKWIDQSQSLNLFYKGTSGKEIADMYMYAYDMGLKTTYYLRTLAASSVEGATTNIKKGTSTSFAPVADQPIPFVKTVSQTQAASLENYVAIDPTKDLVNVMKTKEKTYNEPTVSSYNVKTYSEVNHALNIIKEKTENIVATAPSATKTFKIGGKEFKIHKVLDPECEACQ
jgi:ribonucleotide reductase alpha subunit